MGDSSGHPYRADTRIGYGISLVAAAIGPGLRLVHMPGLSRAIFARRMRGCRSLIRPDEYRAALASSRAYRFPRSVSVSFARLAWWRACLPRNSNASGNPLGSLVLESVPVPPGAGVVSLVAAAGLLAAALFPLPPFRLLTGGEGSDELPVAHSRILPQPLLLQNVGSRRDSRSPWHNTPSVSAVSGGV